MYYVHNHNSSMCIMLKSTVFDYLHGTNCVMCSWGAATIGKMLEMPWPSRMQNVWSLGC